jgi:hypothetical protein
LFNLSVELYKEAFKNEIFKVKNSQTTMAFNMYYFFEDEIKKYIELMVPSQILKEIESYNKLNSDLQIDIYKIIFALLYIESR